VTDKEAERVAASFGLTVRAQPLGSQQDSNFLWLTAKVLGVMKIANPAFSAAEIEDEGRRGRAYDGACGEPAGSDPTHGPVTGAGGRGRGVGRVLRYLTGGTLAGAGRYLSPGGRPGPLGKRWPAGEPWR